MADICASRDLDKFYTKRHIAEECVRIFRDAVKYDARDLIIEPSVGAGAFCDPILQLWRERLFIDIAPEMRGAIKANFLDIEPPSRNLDHQVHVLGNPPFGRQSNPLCGARRFIRKAASFQRCGDAIGFILPISFRKPSFARAFPANYLRIHDSEIEENAFILDGADYDVRCVFQIYVCGDRPANNFIRQACLRRRKPSLEPIAHSSWDYVKKDTAIASDRAIAVRRVGGKAGFATTNIADCNPQCFYFIILSAHCVERIPLHDIIARLSAEVYAHNTVGPRSIAKGEVGERLTAIIG